MKSCSPLSPLSLDVADALRPADYAECELNRLEGCWKKFNDDPKRQLALADEMMRAAEQGDLAAVSPARVSMIYERQGELLIAIGQPQRGAEALHYAAMLPAFTLLRPKL